MPESLIHRRFESQARLRPDAIAIETEREHLTYAELDGRADRLAEALIAAGVRAETPVGICAERGIETIIGLLGILKAGGAYFPLEATYPRERLAIMLDDARPPVILTHAKLVERLPTSTAVVLSLAGEPFPLTRSAKGVGGEDQDQRPEIPAPSPISTPGRRLRQGLPSPTGDSLAYLPFTSGSTGRPKGVEIVHHSVVRLVCGNDYADFGPDQTFLHIAPLAFDASTFEIWGALLNGGRLVIAPPGPLSLAELGDALRSHGVTTLWLTAGLFHLMVDERLDDLGGLRQLLAGGDALSVRHVRRLRDRFPYLRLINGYGPTEATTFACCHTIDNLPPDAPRVPIGRPIAGTFVAVLDEDGVAVPEDVPGELYIGGEGLARGYHHRPDLTAERFVPHPYEPGVKLYRTGDRVVLRDDGVVDFLGRVDSQVKLRGFRVEPAEVEAAILRHPEIAQAVVAAREDTPGDKRLVGYYVSRDGEELPDLAHFLRDHLPEFMVPSALVRLAALPLTPNGKVDRAHLPVPEAVSWPAVIPLDAAQRRLQRIWQSVLPGEPPPLDVPFLEAGGDSLMALKLLGEIGREFGRDPGAAAVLRGGTIRSLAELISRTAVAQPRALVPIQPRGSRPPLYLVHPLGGQVMGFRLLGEYLGEDQPLYGLQASAHAEKAPPTIEEMAKHYLGEVEAHQRAGDVFLGGYSMGAFVAFEMARLLRDRGRTVGLLAVIDDGPALLRSRPDPEIRELIGFLINLAPWLRHQLTRRTPADVLRDCLRKLRVWMRKSAGLDSVLDPTRFAATMQVTLHTHYRTIQRYVPRPCPLRVTLFRAGVQPIFGSHRPDLGWSSVAEHGVEVHTTPGHHETLLADPWVRELAARISKSLGRRSGRRAA